MKRRSTINIKHRPYQPKPANTYTPNGKRECERRLRQMAKIAARPNVRAAVL